MKEHPRILHPIQTRSSKDNITAFLLVSRVSINFNVRVGILYSYVSVSLGGDMKGMCKLYRLRGQDDSEDHLGICGVATVGRYL